MCVSEVQTQVDGRATVYCSVLIGPGLVYTTVLIEFPLSLTSGIAGQSLCRPGHIKDMELHNMFDKSDYSLDHPQTYIPPVCSTVS